MAKNKFPRSVSFNLKNPEDVAILEYLKRRNFSGYVKDLIKADMKSKNVSLMSNSQKPLSKLEQLRQNINNYTSNDSDTESNK